jgi:hypothetical protein
VSTSALVQSGTPAARPTSVLRPVPRQPLREPAQLSLERMERHAADVYGRYWRDKLGPKHVLPALGGTVTLDETDVFQDEATLAWFRKHVGEAREETEEEMAARRRRSWHTEPYRRPIVYPTIVYSGCGTDIMASSKRAMGKPRLRLARGTVVTAIGPNGAHFRMHLPTDTIFMARERHVSHSRYASTTTSNFERGGWQFVAANAHITEIESLAAAGQLSLVGAA